MKKRNIFIVVIIALVIGVIVIDGYYLGPLNFRRSLNGQWPIMTRDVPHDGGGNWHLGITYTITTSFSDVEFKSKMPFVSNRNEQRVGEI